MSERLQYTAITLLFPLIIVLNYLLPDAVNRPDQPKGVFNLFLVILTLLLLFLLIHGHVMGRQPAVRIRAVMDVSLIFGVLFLIWLLALGKFGFLDPIRWPSPNVVFGVFQSDLDLLVVGSSLGSLERLIIGYALGMVLGIPIGLVVGRYTKLHDMAVYPIAKIIAPIPPIIFVPYAIEILPTIGQAVIFVIFIGAFWPIYVNTVYGVRNLDYRYIEAARTLGADEKRLYTRVLLPGALPSISVGLFIGLVLSFIVLAVAEGIGGSITTPGLGWYVLYYADLFDYPKVVAAILLVAFWVLIWTGISDRIQGRALRWQKKL